MKKILIVLIAIMTVSLSGCGTIKEKASDMFWGAISAQLEKEEAERQRKYENHEVVIGRDTVAVFGKHYDIGKTYSDGKRIDHLWIVVEDADGVILSGVTHYDSRRGCFYVVAEEGYAVVDKNDYCRVYKPLPDGEPEYDHYIESKYIEYLDSYDEFSEKERKYFEKMQKK